jgi:acetolactate synthase-1/2/3 large subunit
MIKVSDYIMQRVVEYGVKDVFMITGGGAMHLVDSVGKTKGMRYLCPHHEQAAAIAAEGYSRTCGKMGVVVVTSGPGGTNTLTGVIGQWLDSIPCLYISGQVKRETTIAACPDIKLRQLGDQEINIIDIVKPVTKYAVSVRDAMTIRYHLEKAVHEAIHGRPGPVWLDIPLDIQASMIDEKKLKGYRAQENDSLKIRVSQKKQVSRVVELLKKAKRPVILAGHGVRIAGAIDILEEIVSKLKIPVITTFNGIDIVGNDNKYYAGRPGTVGTRFGNYSIQNCDVLISIGSRNNIRQISYNWKYYAREATKIIVDIDEAELQKPTVKPEIAIHLDAKVFLHELDRQTRGKVFPDWCEWLKWCQDKRRRYPVVLNEYWKKNKPVNPYCFIDALTKEMKNNATIVAGNGTACVALYQAGTVKKGQRIFWNSGCASMGYDLPAAIGACVAHNKKRTVVCLAGDGSLQMNVQELQTVAFNKLPIKLFVLSNDGYVSIRQTQENFFQGRFVGCDSSSGVSFPEMRKIAKAYKIRYERIESHADIKGKVRKIMSYAGPVICEVVLDPCQKFIPKVASDKKPDGRMVSKPLEDMFPFLEREEFLRNMIIKPIVEK